MPLASERDLSCGRLAAARPSGHKKKSGNDLLSHLMGSTIGAGGLNFRVRNGNGWDPSAIVARLKSSRLELRRREGGGALAGPEETGGRGPASLAGAQLAGYGGQTREAVESCNSFFRRVAEQRHRPLLEKETRNNMVKPHGELVLVG